MVFKKGENKMNGKIQNSIMLSLAMLLFVFSITEAQPRFRRRQPIRRYQPSAAIGLRVGNDFEHDNYMLGGQLWLPAGRFWKLVPSFDYYFVDKTKPFDLWQFNGDLVFKPHPRSPLYFGGGVAVDYIISDSGERSTDTGGNAIVGLEFGSGGRLPMYPYIQARWTFQDKTFFSVVGGINFSLR